MMTEITSLQNPLIKRIRSLKHRKYRQREGRFWAEGIRIVLEALELRWDVEALVWAPDLLTSHSAHQAIVRMPEKTVAVSGQVFRSLSSRDNPQGVGALVRIPERRLEDLSIGPETFLLVLEDAQDPGNVGTVVRTADCTGCHGVIMLGNCADPYAPQAVRASMGSLFSLPVVTGVATSDFLRWARAVNLRLVGTSARAAVGYREADYSRPLALLFGSEQRGMSEALCRAAHETVCIPIQGRASSLNLSSAVAVMAYRGLAVRKIRPSGSTQRCAPGTTGAGL